MGSINGAQKLEAGSWESEGGGGQGW